MAKKRGFVLGDHQFLHPTETGPLSRLRLKPRQILGAAPPRFLDGLAAESTKKSPAAKDLYKGKFCGHGEPTMTIFDIVVDGSDVLEISAINDADAAADLQNVKALVVRKPGKDNPWIALFRRSWEEKQATLEGVVRKPLSKAEVAQVSKSVAKGKVSVGFEYPCDASSRDCVSWMTIDALFDGHRRPYCVVNAEMA